MGGSIWRRDRSRRAREGQQGEGGLRDTPDAADLAQQIIDQKSTVLPIANIPKPTIAALSGAVAGAGPGVDLAADIRVASENLVMRIAFTAIRLSGDRQDSTVDEELDHGKDEDGQFDAPTSVEPAHRGGGRPGDARAREQLRLTRSKKNNSRSRADGANHGSRRPSTRRGSPRTSPRRKHDRTQPHAGRERSRRTSLQRTYEEKPHNATKGNDENQPQPSRGRAHLRRITPTRSTIRKQSPPTATTQKVIGSENGLA
ncbi:MULTISPECIES: enoyl-CoA hydratase-related protein [unclassified Rhodococcus (in: high G+C Gram-positive bacteria)]|uniref:enoyl-CoA hydratase-related protein n=1 Tax=unclassified Rhodococcus (in: high G+C Gram-positive bacteria) TaxID=192944 RepID=UPI0012E73D28